MFVPLNREAGPGDLGPHFKISNIMKSSTVGLCLGLQDGFLGPHHSLTYLFILIFII